VTEGTEVREAMQVVFSLDDEKTQKKGSPGTSGVSERTSLYGLIEDEVNIVEGIIIEIRKSGKVIKWDKYHG